MLWRKRSGLERTRHMVGAELRGCTSHRTLSASEGSWENNSILKSRMTPSERRTNIRSQGQSKGTCWEATAAMEGGGVQGVSQELWSSWDTGA